MSCNPIWTASWKEAFFSFIARVASPTTRSTSSLVTGRR